VKNSTLESILRSLIRIIGQDSNAPIFAITSYCSSDFPDSIAASNVDFFEQDDNANTDKPESKTIKNEILVILNQVFHESSVILQPMKTKTLKKNKVNVVTLGCSKNIYDSEVMMAQLKANAFDVEHESMDDDASIVIINTCGFIDNAKQESIDTIIRYAEAKAEGLVDKVYVTGCLSERYKDDLEKEIYLAF